MAFNSKRIYPIDLQPRKAIGVSLPFTGKAVFNSTFQTKDAIKANLINFLLTGQGERYMNPLFGTPLRNLLFENITQEVISEVGSVINRGLQEYFPSVVVTDFKVLGVPDRNTVSLILKYAISNTNISDEVVINFEQ
jgi:phage baseplate assembly protein W